MTLAARGDTPFARSVEWVALTPEERRRRAVEAARDRNEDVLWSLTVGHLALRGKAGSRVSAATLRTYRSGVRRFLAAAEGVSLLALPEDFPMLWLRQLEAAGFKPSSVRVWLAGARRLYAALSWVGAVRGNPLVGVTPAGDPVPAWEKRQPYADEDVARLIEHSRGVIRFLVLLCAHCGLRVSEACRLEWGDVDLAGGVLRVRGAKGAAERVVPLSSTAAREFGRWARSSGRVVERTPQGARAAMRSLCRRAGVQYQGLHSLRHSAGTRLYRETHDFEDVARFLGHSKLETTRIYAKWNDERLRSAVLRW